MATLEELQAQLQRWSAAGLITDEQAAAIAAAERREAAAAAPPPRRTRVVAELLGYLGGALAGVGALLLAAQVWPELATWARLSLLALAAVALWAAGALVRVQADPVLARLRGVLWLLSSGAVAGFAGLYAADVLDLDGEWVALVAGLAAAVQSGLLWRLMDRPLQQLACLAGLAVAAGAGTAGLGGNEAAAGVAVWALGVAWVVAAWYRLLPPPLAAQAVGAVVLLVGPLVAAGQWNDAAPVGGLISALCLLGAGTAGRRPALAAMGIGGIVVYLPWTVGQLFEGAVGAPIVLVVTGVALLTVMMVLLRAPWRHTGRPHARV